MSRFNKAPLIKLISGQKRLVHVSRTLFRPQGHGDISLGVDRTIESNLKSDTNRLAKTLSKFWEKVDTEFNAESNQYEIQLDGKTLKTPMGFPLALPKEKRQLAFLIQHEWSSLPNLKIQTNSMPMTSLAARSIDLETCNRMNDGELITKVGRIDDVKYNLLRYLDTDTCLIFTTADEYDGKLRQRQLQLYMPLIREYEQFFTIYAISQPQLVSRDTISRDTTLQLSYLDCETDGLRGNKQSITMQNVVLDWMNRLTVYELVALEKAVLTTKSFLCGVSMLRSSVGDVARQSRHFQVNKNHPEEYYFKTIDDIVELGNLETIFQTKLWGEVEDTHDVDKADWLRNLSSAALLCH